MTAAAFWEGRGGEARWVVAMVVAVVVAVVAAVVVAMVVAVGVVPLATPEAHFGRRQHQLAEGRRRSGLGVLPYSF